MRKTIWRRAPLPLLVAACVAAAAGIGRAQKAPLDEAADPAEIEANFSVGGEVALSSLVALSDGHMQKLADSLHILARSEAARSGEWARIRDGLADLSERNVAALNWFALPDGSYWSVQDGREQGSLARRDYFPEVLEGKTILGELVVSGATGKPVAIVAVPVVGSEGEVVGVLGASVYLDRLSARIDREMGVGDSQIFYSFDEQPLVALVWDPELVFLEPMEAGEEDLARAFAEMLERDSGTISYTFRGRQRQVAFRRSDVTGWWYAYGVVSEPERPPETPLP